MKVLVTGCAGQLGYDVLEQLAARCIPFIASDKADFDLTNREAVRGFIEMHKPTAIVHSAAYTAVDRAEEDAAK